jgi:uncharacterized membrane protein YdcZ (DUF606 family)
MHMIKSPRSTRRVAALVALGVLTACSPDSSPLGPTAAPAPRSELLGGLLGGVVGGVVGVVVNVVAVLTTPLLAPTATRTASISGEQVVAYVGRSGGTITLPKSGLTVVVPYGAVSSTTKFTITAPAGTAVAYDFQPHGLKFAAPLVVTQDLTKLAYTLSSGPTLRAGYYGEGSLDLTNNTALVTEIFPVAFNAAGTRATFKIGHFSGYMMSTGLTDEKIEESQDPSMEMPQ